MDRFFFHNYILRQPRLLLNLACNFKWVCWTSKLLRRVELVLLKIEADAGVEVHCVSSDFVCVFSILLLLWKMLVSPPPSATMFWVKNKFASDSLAFWKIHFVFGGGR